MAAVAPTGPKIREVPFGEAEFKAISNIAYDVAGLSIAESKKSLVYSRLLKRLRHLEIADFVAYVDLLEGPDGTTELDHLIAALTTNVTSFFREAHHFEHLRERVIPELVSRARAGKRVRLWSAACSSGEEAYSMAMCVLGDAPELRQMDMRILATDIDAEMLARARVGTYASDALHAVPGDLRRHFLSGKAQATEITMPSELRNNVTFRQLNLIGDWPFSGSFDVIFCRNVAIYFDKPTQVRLWTRLHEMLSPGGYLYIGHSERVSGPAAQWLTNCGSTQYFNASAPVPGHFTSKGQRDVT